VRVARLDGLEEQFAEVVQQMTRVKIERDTAVCRAEVAEEAATLAIDRASLLQGERDLLEEELRQVRTGSNYYLRGYGCPFVRGSQADLGKCSYSVLLRDRCAL
jgi:hypothetical protein